MNDLINFKLGCPADAVTIDGLSDTLKTFKKLLVAAKAADWRIRDVGIHSVAVAAEPVVADEETDKSLRTVRDVVGAVESRDVARMLDYREEVESIIALSAKYSSPVEFGAGGDHTTMTVEDAKKISEMLKRSGRPSYGRVRGIVYRLMIEPGHRSIGLYDDVTGEKVGVAFAEELDDAVKQLRIGAHVSIKGFKRTHEGKIIGKVRAEEIRQLPPRRHAMVSAAVLASAKFAGASVVYSWDARFAEAVEKANSIAPLGITVEEPPELPVPAPVEPDDKLLTLFPDEDGDGTE